MASNNSIRVDDRQSIKTEHIYAKFSRKMTLVVLAVAIFFAVIIFSLLSRYAIASMTERSRLDIAQTSQRINNLIEKIAGDLRQALFMGLIASKAQAEEDTNIDAELHRLMRLFPGILRIDVNDSAKARAVTSQRGWPKPFISELVTPLGLPTTTSPNLNTFFFSREISFINRAPVIKIICCLAEQCDKSAIAYFSLQAFQREIRIKDIDSTVYIIDSADRVISHPNRLVSHSLFEQSKKMASHFADVRTQSLGAPSTSLHFASWSEPLLLTTIKLNDSGWVAVSERRGISAFSPVLILVVGLLLIIVAGTVAAVTGANIVARRVVAPIGNLLKFSQQMQLQTKLGVNYVPENLRTGDELESLALHIQHAGAVIQDYTQNLEQKVADKTQQLELANKHKSEFLANMSHELRTPLNAVIGFSDALREEYFGALNDKQREYVNDIALSGQHLLSLINDILDLSKIESGMMDLLYTHFSVASAIDNAMVLIRERAIRQEVTVTSEIGEGVDLLYADERKFKQVLINLLTNAVKFTYPNGWVKIRAVIEGENLLVSVADSGLGIAAEDFETVFQEFRQLTSVGEAKHEGTGLGLPLAKRIVELHGGRIWLESELGKGATFLFVIPLDGECDDVE
jgi:signal transduction histidine kinase